MHTNPVVSCSLFVERWDTYQQGSLISRKLIYLAKSYSASFLIFPAFHGNQTKLKKIRHKCIHIQSKTTKRIKFLNISILHFQFKPKQNQTKSNPIRNLLRLPIQTNQKKKKRFTLVSRSLLGDSSSDWLVEFFGNCLSESSRINSTQNKH